jgi:hypothetical protein
MIVAARVEGERFANFKSEASQALTFVLRITEL